MDQLYQRLTQRVDAWRASGYRHEQYPAIAEALEWSCDVETGELRYLRKPQLRALETYWYLRLVEDTPHVYDLYRKCFPKTSELLPALGLGHSEIQSFLLDNSLDALVERVKTDDDLVRRLRLQSVRETLALDYPSYILALAMGAGKTVLIGAIIATEFAMAMEYPDGQFVQNALVFAPGKTILLGPFREFAEMPYDKILPPRMYKPFAASMKLTFTRDGEKDIPVIRGSSFNVIVTNIEKIRIQKEKVRKKDLGQMSLLVDEDKAKEDVANLRLTAIASLPHLAIFSDEAHHTYGQPLNNELKKVRKTVDYLAAKTNVIVAINTTGTPYAGRQPLRDVIFWYGLADGIREGYLKDVAGNILRYEFDGQMETYLDHVVKDFFAEYGDVALPDGSPARIAIYFPQTDDIDECRPAIDKAMTEVGLGPAHCLVNTSNEALTSRADEDAFERLRNDPAAPHRVILLVNRGTEGWDCPSLFACALARRLENAPNFVLQAASRCLRQVPGNTRKARIYLSADNFGLLDNQLRQTYGETIEQLDRTAQETNREKIVLRKLRIPPLVIPQLIRTVVPKAGEVGPVKLTQPTAKTGGTLTRYAHSLAVQYASDSVMVQEGDGIEIETVPDTADAYSAAVELAGRYRIDVWTVYDELRLAGRYRIDVWTVYDELRRLYRDSDIPLAHVDALAGQIEEQTRRYEVKEDYVEVALALVKPEGFDIEVGEDGVEVYTAEITYPKGKEHLLARIADWNGKAGRFGFHYAPYNFDSGLEMSFFEQLLYHLKLHPDDIEDIYFTGALTSPARTEFFIEYMDEEGRPHRYTPDFLIRRKPAPGRKPGTGRVYIVEIKRLHDRDHPIDGENGRKAMAVRKWEKLNPDLLRYEIMFADGSTMPPDAMRNVKAFIEESGSGQEEGQEEG